ncbi:transposase family protein [Hymenobacter elongatus]|uniref:transposase family protein n=1 Tax=Hymenobacter elongatus TaxID=877208 RepID=UPI001FD8B3EB|nr:transposase family protein [Hymenobacter elongatus]
MAANAQRKLVYVSRVVPGSMHDFTLLKKLLSSDKAWFEGLKMRVDSGFQGCGKTYRCGKLFLPTKKSKNRPLTKNYKFRNTQQARKRVMVEHSLGGLKRYHILADRLRMRNLDQFDVALEVCAGLWNFCLTH